MPIGTAASFLSSHFHYSGSAIQALRTYHKGYLSHPTMGAALSPRHVIELVMCFQDLAAQLEVCPALWPTIHWFVCSGPWGFCVV